MVRTHIAKVVDLLNARTLVQNESIHGEPFP